MAYCILTAVIGITAFFMGKFTTETNPDHDNWNLDYCISNIKIIDWNTNGNELSMLLSDGTEIYATKEKDLYSPQLKQYIAFDEIKNITIEPENILIEITNGNIYELKGEYKCISQN